MTRRLVAALMAVVLAFTVVPMSVNAQENSAETELINGSGVDAQSAEVATTEEDEEAVVSTPVDASEELNGSAVDALEESSEELNGDAEVTSIGSIALYDVGTGELIQPKKNKHYSFSEVFSIYLNVYIVLYRVGEEQEEKIDFSTINSNTELQAKLIKTSAVKLVYGKTFNEGSNSYYFTLKPWKYYGSTVDKWDKIIPSSGQFKLNFTLDSNKKVSKSVVIDGDQYVADAGDLALTILYTQATRTYKSCNSKKVVLSQNYSNATYSYNAPSEEKGNYISEDFTAEYAYIVVELNKFVETSVDDNGVRTGHWLSFRSSENVSSEECNPYNIKCSINVTGGRIVYSNKNDGQYGIEPSVNAKEVVITFKDSQNVKRIYKIKNLTSYDNEGNKNNYQKQKIELKQLSKMYTVDLYEDGLDSADQCTVDKVTYQQVKFKVTNKTKLSNEELASGYKIQLRRVLGSSVKHYGLYELDNADTTTESSFGGEYSVSLDSETDTLTIALNNEFACKAGNFQYKAYLLDSNNNLVVAPFTFYIKVNKVPTAVCKLSKTTVTINTKTWDSDEFIYPHVTVPLTCTTAPYTTKISSGTLENVTYKNGTTNSFTTYFDAGAWKDGTVGFFLKNDANNEETIAYLKKNPKERVGYVTIDYYDYFGKLKTIRQKVTINIK